MSNTSLNQCPNCGAGLAPVNSNVIKCPYCGSAFNNPNKQTRQTEAGDINTGAGTQRKTVNQQKRSGILDPDLNPKPTPPLKWRKGTRTAYIFLFFALSFFISVIVLTADKHDDNDHLPITDTLKTDTSSRFISGKNSIYDSVNNSSITAILKQLSPIKTDSITFRKLYAEARKKNNQPSNNIFIYDRSSPKAIKDNGIYVYIDKTGKGSSLRYCIQYNADDWLFINKVIFNVDAESYVYEPAEFKRGNEDLRIWEWSDDRINDSSLFILVKIAISKKAQARYDGPKNYEVIPITPQQKEALSRQLQIYKGLLLGYDK